MAQWKRKHLMRIWPNFKCHQTTGRAFGLGMLTNCWRSQKEFSAHIIRGSMAKVKMFVHKIPISGESISGRTYTGETVWPINRLPVLNGAATHPLLLFFLLYLPYNLQYVKLKYSFNTTHMILASVANTSAVWRNYFPIAWKKGKKKHTHTHTGALVWAQAEARVQH